MRVAGQRGHRGPALENGFEPWFRHRVEVVVDPDGVVAGPLRLQRAAAHGLVLFDRVSNVRQVHAPALGYEDADLQLWCGHVVIVLGFNEQPLGPLDCTRATMARTRGAVVASPGVVDPEATYRQ